MKLKDLLEKKGITAYKLSKESKVSESTLSEILKGNRKEVRLSTAKKIAHALNVSVEEIEIGDDLYEGNS